MKTNRTENILDFVDLLDCIRSATIGMAKHLRNKAEEIHGTEDYKQISEKAQLMTDISHVISDAILILKMKQKTVIDDED